METLETSEVLNENGVCVNLNKTLEKVPAFTFSKSCNGFGSDPDDSVTQNATGAAIRSTVIGNDEVVNHTFHIEKRVAGTIENGESCFDFGEIRKGSSKDEAFGALKRVLATKGLNNIDSSQLDGVDPGNMLEVSRKGGISLFVDVFGPLQEFDKCDDSSSMASERNFNHEKNSMLFHDSVENTSSILSDIRVPKVNIEETKQETDTTSDQECCKFSMGDFVWAKIKTQLWWPGQICNPSNASNDASKSSKDCFVVQYFGNGSFVQCASRQLKPFIECFEQMSKQSNSRSFLSAVKKAVGEIGIRVKLEMTCSCFPESAAKGKNGEVSEFPVKRFEPLNFLAYVKDLAKDVLVPNVIDCTVAQSHLSAVYRAMGHRQLSMDQLLPTTDVPNDKARNDSKSIERKVSNGYELRERRKSMSLVVAKHVEMEMNNTSARLVGSDPTVKSQSKNSKKKRFEKADTEASSAEMISELRFTALDCLYPRKSKCFDVALRYFSRFRKFNFSSKEETLGKAVAYGASNVNQTAEIYATQENPPEKGGSLSGVKPKKRQREKKERKISVGPENTPTAELTNIDGGIATSCSVIIDFRNTNSINPEVRSVPKKRKKTEAAPSSNNGDITSSGSMVIDFQKAGPTPASRSVPKKRRKKTGVTPVSLLAMHTGDGLDLNLNVATNSPVIIDFQKNVPVSPEGQFILENVAKNAEGTPVLPHIKETADSPAFSHLQFMGSAVPQRKLEPKKRKRKEGSKMKDVDGKSNVVLPDVKGSSAKFVPVLKDLQAKSIPKASSEEGLKEATLSNMNFELNVNTVDLNGNNVEPGLLESNKRKGNEKISECASLLPDLNEITPEPNSSDLIMPKSQPKKGSKAADNKVFDVNLGSTNRMQSDGEALGTALLLKFTDEFSLPSKETLISTFFGFGQLKESETITLSECSSAQVVFMRSCDARDAFLSLTKCNPFGPALVNYQLHHLSSALEADCNNNNNNNVRVPMFLPIDGLNNPVKPKVPRKPRVPTKAKTTAKIEAPLVHTVPPRVAFGLKGPQNEAPDIYVIRQKLEMMTSMMEKAGNNLAPQMRAKLEGEINGLLNRIRTMSDSS